MRMTILCLKVSRAWPRLLLSLFVAGCVVSSALTHAALPNIVLCMADDQGWGDTAYNGHPC
jgi:hypothetical protein